MRYLTLAAVAAAATMIADASFAGEADVVGADAGWEHYADKWEVLTPDGKVINTRVLAHPHDNEQPFTRSLGGIRIPAGMAKVRVRAHDKVHGYGGAEMDVDMKTGQASPGGGQS
jgi:hypothetical protein